MNAVLVELVSRWRKEHAERRDASIRAGDERNYGRSLGIEGCADALESALATLAASDAPKCACHTARMCPLHEKIPTPTPASGEPVAWLRYRPDGQPDWAEDCVAEDEHFLDDALAREGYTLRPLFATPQSVGLSESEREALDHCEQRSARKAGEFYTKSENENIVTICAALRRLAALGDSND